MEARRGMKNSTLIQANVIYLILIPKKILVYNIFTFFLFFRGLFKPLHNQGVYMEFKKFKEIGHKIGLTSLFCEIIDDKVIF